MTKRLVTVTLAIDDDGSVSLASGGAVESALLEVTRKPKPKIDAPVEPEKDWVHGYDAKHLGADYPAVHLPIVTNKAVIAPLIQDSFYGQDAPDEVTAKEGVLRYNGYSVVMNKDRRVAIYSAANLDGGADFNLSRPSDKWMFDARIEREHQIGNSFYAHNKIDRGHLTRREDMEWGGDPIDATRRANGTCTWTNCSPQHELFNQDKHPDKSIRLWQGLERYILEESARVHKFRVQAFTGPIFDADDPIYREVKIPLDYWKVVVAISGEGALFATGYILTQRAVLDVTDLDEAAPAEPFGQFQTYQRTLAEIEGLTGLVFTYGDGASLREVDPLARELAKPSWKRRSRPAAIGLRESAVIPDDAAFDQPLDGFGAILLG